MWFNILPIKARACSSKPSCTRGIFCRRWDERSQHISLRNEAGRPCLLNTAALLWFAVVLPSGDPETRSALAQAQLCCSQKKLQPGDKMFQHAVPVSSMRALIGALISTGGKYSANEKFSGKHLCSEVVFWTPEWLIQCNFVFLARQSQASHCFVSSVPGQTPQRQSGFGLMLICPTGRAASLHPAFLHPSAPL